MLLSRAVRLLGRGCRRYYSAHTTPLSHPHGVKSPTASRKLEPQNVQMSQLRNGLVIAALENYCPVSKVGIFVKAGSRYEDAGNLGITHCLRVASNLTSRRASSFKLTRAIEAVGGNLRVTSTRDIMLYSVECMRDYMSAGKPARGCLSQYTLQPALLSRLHAGSVHLRTGVTLNQLTKAAQELFAKKSGHSQTGAKAQYGGGEHRDPNCERLVHAAVVCEGTALGSPEALSFAVLQQVLGAGPYIKRGSHITSTLTKAVNKATTQPFTASAFNASYLDSGLFGVYTISQDKEAAGVINAAVSHVKQVAKGEITEADIERGKNQLIARSLMTVETVDVLLKEIGLQALATGTYVSPTSAVEKIKEITNKDVIKAANKFASGAKSMAASGRLVNTPFLDEL
ncbi:cytochrome b-c1 complex subunit 2, mitochondrial-like isoform X2 [Heterodontus francisci]|uniref:cytochrome b-c1 complex subunit 2, mitochondrial-like isoform X2 n=1 Tax=Heterodontus francisci TaxID=7792 RepID=UPI00355C6EA3